MTSKEEKQASPQQGLHRAWKWAFELLFVIGVVVAIHYYQTADMALGEAPDLGLEQASTLFYTANAEQRPVLVHFWATWCPICKLEQGTIQSLSEVYSIITVASHSGIDEEIRRYMDENGIRFPVIIDEMGSIAKEWGVSGFPASFVLDEQNMIRYRSMGYTTGWGLRFRMWLARGSQ